MKKEEEEKKKGGLETDAPILRNKEKKLDLAEVKKGGGF